MDLHVQPAPHRGRLGGGLSSLLAFGAILGVAAGALVLVLWPAPVEATGSLVQDRDGDGLSSAQEAVIGTYAHQADTDGDGFSDAEELARGSSPQSDQSVPAAGPLAVGLTAYGSAGAVRLTAAFYVEDGQLQGKSLTFGALHGERLVLLAPGAIAAAGSYRMKDGATPGSKVVLIETPIPPSAVHAYGHLTLFAALGEASTGTVAAAEALNLTSANGVIYLHVSHTAAGGVPGVPLDPGIVYKPIPPEGPGSIPSTMAPGQICFQTTQVVGFSGPMVTHEVVSADCLPDWDAFCGVDCSTSVGTTFQGLDPSVLVGL